MVEPHSSNFRVIKTNFLDIRIFRKFMVATVMILNILTDRSGQTVKSLPDQAEGAVWWRSTLSFIMHLLDVCACCFNFWIIAAFSCVRSFGTFTLLYMGPVKRICVFEHSVMTNFNCACPAIQRRQGSGCLSEGSSWLTACMSEQRRFWQDCADAQARLNLRCSHRR